MEWIKNFNLILVSGSPRRKELLKKSGFEFAVKKIKIEESYPAGIKVVDVAEYLAIKKFDFATKNIILKKNDIIVTADTIVLKNDLILGKPKDIMEAESILQLLSGCEHKVITGVCIGNIDKKLSFSTVSTVYFDKLEDEEIDYYITHCKVLDKAGAYGIQDWLGMCKISKIDGSYTNIVGLPTRDFYRNLKEFCVKTN